MESIITEPVSQNKYVCSHCFEFCDSSIQYENNSFCCYGCKTVFFILKTNHLEDQYSKLLLLKNKKEKKSFTYLDDLNFISLYQSHVDDQTMTMDFYIDGIHCLACLYIIEKLPLFCSAVISANLNIGTNVVRIKILKNSKFSEVAQVIYQLGYNLNPLKNEDDLRQKIIQDDRKMLVKIAIAGAVSGNIMILAIATYAGANDFFSISFNLLSGLFSLPVIFYSALPFYKNVIVSLKQKTMAIDLPIVLAIVTATFVSYYALFNNSEHVYFDSITALIFFLLSTRFILHKFTQKILDKSNLININKTKIVKKIVNDVVSDVHISTIKSGDLIKISPSETIPVDGIIVSGFSEINMSTFTGETRPVILTTGDMVYASTLNLNSELIIKVMETDDQTKIGKILKEVITNSEKNTKTLKLTSQVGKWFLLAMIISSIAILLYFSLTISLNVGISRALTLLIVTCPCALGIGAPLSFYTAIKKLLSKSIIVKNENTLERILECKKIFFDKTGTLTKGNYVVRNTSDLNQLSKKELSIIYHLEKYSKHPIAYALSSFCQKQALNINDQIEIINYKENIGLGVEGYFENNFYELKKGTESGSDEIVTTVNFYQNKNLVSTFILEDELQVNTFAIIENLNRYNLRPFIISGDQKSIVNSVAKKLNIPLKNTFSNLSPEDKKEIIKNNPLSIMIGDGSNDSLALKASHVGIAVKGSVDLSLSSSDLYFTDGGLQNIFSVLIAAKETKKLIKRNLLISSFYNITAGTLAMLGIMNPLLAAIFMPVSSLSVIASNIFGTKQLRLVFKENH